jgi:CheY-like chemotaxis protein
VKIDSARNVFAAIKDSVLARKKTLPPTVLIVDDEEPVRNYVQLVLARHGYQTLVAADATEALQIAWTNGKLDLLLTDLVMPGVQGDELARRLRNAQPDLPVLYLTGFCDRLFIERQLLWNGEAFLEKPFTPKGLMEAVALIRAMSRELIA